jgi:XRE family transcriptional regulator, fatty acid utilization regulator
MAGERSVYLGPRMKRLRRELGLTQAQVAADLEISASYVALLERNQRPLTADLLLRLARTYRIDLSDFASEGAQDQAARLNAALKDPMFADIDLPALEVSDAAANFPGISEAFLRLHTAWAERQIELADRAAQAASEGDGQDGATDPVAEVQWFLAARRNCFPALDEEAETIAARVAEAGGLTAYFKARHRLRVRMLPTEVMAGSQRRYDRHREEVPVGAATRLYRAAPAGRCGDEGRAFHQRCQPAPRPARHRGLCRRGHRHALYGVRQGGRGTRL